MESFEGVSDEEEAPLFGARSRYRDVSSDSEGRSPSPIPPGELGGPGRRAAGKRRGLGDDDGEELIQVDEEADESNVLDVDEVHGGAAAPGSGDVPHGRAALSPSRRRRRVLGPTGEWINADELDGRTVVHEAAALPVRRSSRKRGKAPEHEGSLDNNPFRLVPAQEYGMMAPFDVVVAPQVLITMDYHSHLSVAEVIGLLGGRFDAESKKLHVLSIFPCRSIGTRKECEMDPISEMEAVAQFASLDLMPVGWYHSHPTFEPSPSCRDIETQTMYQVLFSHTADSAEPFLGFIVSPFLKSSKGRSVIECIHLAHCNALDEAFRMPCRVRYQIEATGEFFEHPDDLVDMYERLLRTYRMTPNYAGMYHEQYFVNKLVARLEGMPYEPAARALLQRFRNKVQY